MTKRPSTAAAFALAAWLTGCASDAARWQEPVKRDIDAALEQTQGPAAEAERLTIPPDISRALLPPLEYAPSADEGTPEPRFDLTAKKTDARTVFMSLVKGTPYSIVVHPEVRGEITLQLKDVTVDEALAAIRRVYGYEYRREGNRYLILGQGMQTRLFPVNYLNFNRKGRSTTNVSAGELTQPNGAANSGAGAAQARGIEVETRSESDFWKELQATLEGIIGKEDGRRVVINPPAGLVVVRALPAELDIIEDFLGITQAAVNRQVILEAKIIEVQLNDGFQSGINWAGLGNSGNTDYLLAQTGGGTLLSGLGQSDIAGKSGNLQPDASFAPIASGATSAFGGIFSLALKAQDFAAFIELLKNQGDVHVLSSPRVATVNNQRAVIKVGGDEFFVTGVSNSQTSTGATTILAPEVELTPFFSGIALDVTPQIDERNGIILHIHPTVSNVAQRDKSFVISGSSFSLPLAFSTIQESDNIVRAGSGQVIIIGGLMKEAATESNASVPLLGDIPVVGNLFRHQKMTRIKKELVILLRPSIVDAEGSWASTRGTAREPARRPTRETPP